MVGGTLGEGWDSKHPLGSRGPLPRMSASCLLCLFLFLCQDAVSVGGVGRAEAPGGRRQPKENYGSLTALVEGLGEKERQHQNLSKCEQNTAIWQIHKLRVCNAVKEKTREIPPLLACRGWPAPGWGRTVTVRFMARNRGEEKQGDQLSKRSLRENTF